MMKCIALVDWTWTGHHPTFFNHFILAMEEMGIRVLALCPDPAAAEELAEKTRLTTGGGTQFRTIRVPPRRFRNVRPRRMGAIDWTIRRFTGVENQVREWTRESGIKVDAVFYACIYDRDFEWVHFARPFLRFPWTGLYLQAMSYRMPGRPHPLTCRPPCPEKMFGGRMCKSIGILDEGIVRQVSNSIGKPVVSLPDLADQRPAASPEDRMLGERLKQFAAGRPIVGIFGHLQKSKGILTLLEAARLPDASGICFAFGGDIIWPPDTDEAAQIRRAFAECPNIWNHLERIPSEPSLSYLMASCDVLAAAYVDFPHSSGIQAKAASLRRPLIVSDGYLMAERVKRFRTGEVIPQGDARALLDAILTITKDPAAWVGNNNPLWADYDRQHSFEQFKASLKELLAPI